MPSKERLKGLAIILLVSISFILSIIDSVRVIFENFELENYTQTATATVSSIETVRAKLSPLETYTWKRHVFGSEDFHSNPSAVAYNYTYTYGTSTYTGTFYVPVKGDSTAPKYKEGDKFALRLHKDDVSVSLSEWYTVNAKLNTYEYFMPVVLLLFLAGLILLYFIRNA